MREKERETKWILVTGAGSGIGRKTTELLAQNGFHVYAGDLKLSFVQDLEHNPNILGIKLDVTSDLDMSNFISIINATGLYGVVNNAGIAQGGPLMELQMEELRKQFEVNFFGLHRVTQAVFPFILKQKGRIVIISSNAGCFAAPFIGPYCSSKYAVEGYSDSLRRELMLLGVKVIVIKPGRTKTNIWDKGEELITQYKNGLFGESVKKAGTILLDEGKTKSLEPVKIAELVLKAFTVRNPKTRYARVPNPLGIWARERFPDKIIDALIKKKLLVST